MKTYRIHFPDTKEAHRCGVHPTAFTYSSNRLTDVNCKECLRRIRAASDAPRDNA